MLSLPLSWCINQTKANAHPVTVSGLCKCYGTLCPGPSCSLALQRQAHWESRGSEELELPGVCVMEWHLRAHSRKDWTKQVEEYKEQKCGLARLKRTGKQGALHFDSRILMKGNKQINKQANYFTVSKFEPKLLFEAEPWNTKGGNSVFKHQWAGNWCRIGLSKCGKTLSLSKRHYNIHNAHCDHKRVLVFSCVNTRFIISGLLRCSMETILPKHKKLACANC